MVYPEGPEDGVVVDVDSRGRAHPNGEVRAMSGANPNPDAGMLQREVDRYAVHPL